MNNSRFLVKRAKQPAPKPFPKELLEQAERDALEQDRGWAEYEREQ